MELGLEGAAAFVAGASSGLGYATASVLVAEGCRVAVCSRDVDRINAAAQRLIAESGASSGDVLPVTCDVTDEAAIERGIGETVSAFGGLNILITNAGGPPSGQIESLSPDQWRHAFELNLMSTINLCRAALPYLHEAAAKDDPLAAILMITSVSAKQPIPNLALSNTARAGVQGFAKSLADEVGPVGIRVNTILPGYTRTDRLEELAENITSRTGASRSEVERSWADHAALKRIAEPPEFAAAAAFLVSRQASYITGVALPVDGGRVKHLL